MSFHSHGNIFQQGTSHSESQQSTSAFPLDGNSEVPFLPMQDSQFDILQWYPHFQSCVRYFLDHAQHDGPVQAIAAFVNIQLPFQKTQLPVTSSRLSGSPSSMPTPTAGSFATPGHPAQTTSLTPYIRRLVATGYDFPGVLHGFFGDDWALGVRHLHKVERRNYLFAAKASNWLDVKAQYDMPDGQTVPFLRPLQHVTEEEIVTAESTWSQWLAMQDWMVGPRTPEEPPIIKDEEDA
ncbi:hypothetical protein F4808DRAFT_462778 [Astrocystis sublimbata]|nr:hypothetical protein F4808DRAFT_462778 [Astrocystis sublimbata]